MKKHQKTLMCFQVAESADQCMANALDMTLGLALHVACPGFRQPVLAKEWEACLFLRSALLCSALLCFAVLFYSALLCPTLVYVTPLYPTLLYSGVDPEYLRNN